MPAYLGHAPINRTGTAVFLGATLAFWALAFTATGVFLALMLLGD